MALLAGGRGSPGVELGERHGGSARRGGRGRPASSAWRRAQRRVCGTGQKKEEGERRRREEKEKGKREKKMEKEEKKGKERERESEMAEIAAVIATGRARAPVGRDARNEGE